MGADLIVYIVVGPRNLKEFGEKQKKTCVDNVMEFRERLIGAGELLATGATEVKLRFPSSSATAPESCTIENSRRSTFKLITKSLEEFRASEEYLGVLQEFLQDANCEEEAELLQYDREKIEALVYEILDVWSNGTRDSTWRQSPDNPQEKIFVTGERTWGDEPDGIAYQAIKRAFAFGIADSLGLR